ncbi:MAG: flagellar assembly protein FliW [Planctomycetota bacterium]
MKVESVRFGTVEVADDRVVRFVHPIVGFDELDDYGLIEDPETAPVLWLQSLEAPEVLFPVVDLSLVTADYAVDLDDEMVAALGVERAEDTRLLGILTLHPDPSDISVNLRAPLVLNPSRATAAQLVLQDRELPTRHPVRAEPGAPRCNKEVARASSHAPQG